MGREGGRQRTSSSKVESMNECIAMQALRCGEGMGPPSMLQAGAVSSFVRGRSAIKLCSSYTARPGFMDVMSGVDAVAGLYHVEILDNVVPPNLMSVVAKRLQNETDDWIAAWADEMKGTVAAIEQSAPEGWMLFKETILDHPDVIAKLLQNPDFDKCSINADTLSKQMAFVTELRGAGLGPLFEHTLLAHAKTVLSLGVETIAVTYALYQLNAEIPKVEAIFARQKAIASLRSAVATKGVSLGASLEGRAKLLEKQVRPG